MYLYFAAKVRKSIHIMAYQCKKKQKVILFSNVELKALDAARCPLLGTWQILEG